MPRRKMRPKKKAQIEPGILTEPFQAVCDKNPKDHLPRKKMCGKKDAQIQPGILAKLFKAVCDENDRSVKEDMLTHDGFVVPTVPDISIEEYVNRLFKYCRCDNSCFVALVIYVDRIMMGSDPILMHSHNYHVLICTAMTLACKFLQDQCYSNAHYARVGGLTLQELNMFEVRMLQKLDFDINLSVNVYEEYLNQLCF